MSGTGITPATDTRTRVLLSFAMDSHGAAFAYWLRDRLMKTYGWYAPNAVYMDCVAARELPTEHARTMDQHPSQKISGHVYVAPDERAKFTSQGYKPIGALNPMWNEMYVAAMQQAQAMVMMVTPEYMASEWCLKEWGQFQEENARRAGARQGLLKGVAISFVGGMDKPMQSGKPIDVTNVAILPATKVYGLGGLLWHKEDYGIGESDYQKLCALLGPLT
jgi:hypothetical protein